MAEKMRKALVWLVAYLSYRKDGKGLNRAGKIRTVLAVILLIGVVGLFIERYRDGVPVTPTLGPAGSPSTATSNAPPADNRPPVTVPLSPAYPGAASTVPPPGGSETAPSQSLADPPATETSAQTVLEDEPVGPPLPPAGLSHPTPGLPAGRPAWERYALPSPPAGGRPIIAVIIDDMGLDRRRSEKVVQLPGPITVSLMSYAEDLARQSAEAREHGHEIMMHVPMEPLSEGQDPGPGALLVSLPPEELHRRIETDLDRFDGYVGINNHMGSKFTGYAAGMEMVMEALRRRGLLFIDSLTSEHSVGLSMAQNAGIPAAARNVFLDNAGDLASVNGQLAKVEEIARKKGSVIAIGHPKDATIAALAAWLPSLRAKGLVLVPVSAVVKARQPGNLARH